MELGLGLGLGLGWGWGWVKQRVLTGCIRVGVRVLIVVRVYLLCKILPV